MTDAKPKTKRVRAPKAPEFTHDAIAVRTVGPDDTAYQGFQWPSEIGAIIECPDWSARPSCGNGFHALLDGIGNWGLTWRDKGMVWQVVGVIRDECVSIGDDKVKFPRCRLLYRGDKAGALKLIVPAMVAAIQKDADAKIATGTSGHAAATGTSGHAAATGDSGHAAATGYRGHAAATGTSGHAAATGTSGHAAATGYRGHAAATGDSGIAASLGAEGTAKAGEAGAIALAHWDTDCWPYKLRRVAAFMVGEGGIEAGKTYRLGADGQPELVA